jgi:hypothetical protein
MRCRNLVPILAARKRPQTIPMLGHGHPEHRGFRSLADTLSRHLRQPLHGIVSRPTVLASPSHAAAESVYLIQRRE